jgi:WD40 repeat protein
MAGVTRDLIFISYSHRDRDWLEHLRIFLKPYTRQNLKIWADPYIEVGGQWCRDISAALLRSCVGVLLLSPDFLASDFIYTEELPPLLEGANAGSIILVLIPVSASNYEATPLAKYQFAHPPDRPLDKLRKAQRNMALVEITKRIVAAAQKTAPAVAAAPAPAARPLDVAPIEATGRLAKLHGVPGQRPNYLRRQEYLDRVKQALLAPTDRAVGITGPMPQTARVGLHGMGGIGMTVLAIDLVNDDEVRHAFPDGIFWLTLGQSIKASQLQGELAGLITGEAKAFASVSEARDQLRQLFDGRSCLLILDDLWRPQDAEPFDVLGPRSRLLVTTRDADLLVALGARELPLDVLSQELALELLASWSGQAADILPPTAAKVAQSCGYLPLALALAGARVRAGAGWENVFLALERGRLEFLDHPYGSVFSSLQLSTDALTPSERERYFELAVFPENADIPVETVCCLWRHSGRVVAETSRDLLRRMHRRALLTLRSDSSSILFHDLQRDFLRLNIASLVDAHIALIEAYRAITPAGWASGPDDGYFLQHLPQHLAAADRLDELKSLLCNYDWLAAKLLRLNVSALIADYDLIPRDDDLALIQQALRLSILALLRDRDQLPGQLLGRLRGADGPAVGALVAGAEKGPGRVWLRPRFPLLTPPGGPLRQILVGHTDRVAAVAFLPDARRALSGSWDHTMLLWDLATGDIVRTFKGHTDRVNTVAVLPDGRRALSGSQDRTLRLWDLATGEALVTFFGHTSRVCAVAALPDGSRALSGSDDNSLRRWDLATGDTLGFPLDTLWGHTSGVNTVAVLPDGHRALSGADDNTLRLWDLITRETLRILEGHTGPVHSIAVLPDGTRALSGSWDGTMRLWDLATGETLRTLARHPTYVRAYVNAVAVLPDGRRALSGADDDKNTLRLWDLATGETLRTLEGHAEGVTAVATLPDGSRALSGSADNTLRFWDLTSEEIPRIREAHTGEVTAVRGLSDGSYALSASKDETLRLWDLKTGRTLRTIRPPVDTWLTAVAVLPDGSRILSNCFGKQLGHAMRLWNLATGETLCTLEGHTDLVVSAALVGDGGRALTGSADKTLRLWDLATGQTLRTLEGHTDWVMVVAVLPNGSRALSGSLTRPCGCGIWQPARRYARSEGTLAQ